jgi:hypothetical protein
MLLFQSICVPRSNSPYILHKDASACTSPQPGIVPSHPSSHEPCGVHFSLPRPHLYPYLTICISTRNSRDNPLKACRNHFMQTVRTAPFLFSVGAVEPRFQKQRYNHLPPKGAVGAQASYVLRPETGYRTLNAGPRLSGHPRAWDDMGPKACKHCRAGFGPAEGRRRRGRPASAQTAPGNPGSPHFRGAPRCHQTRSCAGHLGPTNRPVHSPSLLISAGQMVPHQKRKHQPSRVSFHHLPSLPVVV